MPLRQIGRANLLIFMSCISTFLISGRLNPVEKIYDFGIIREDDGKQKGYVYLVNEGDSATFITKVKASCGCTTVSFPSALIEPGDTAKVEFSFNPSGRPGSFEKNLRIYTGENNKSQTVTIMGTVIASSHTLDIRYPEKLGDFRIESLKAHFGRISKGTKRHIYINLYNNSPEEKRLKTEYDSTVITVEQDTDLIKPWNNVCMHITVDSENSETTGNVAYEIKIIDDSEEREERKSANFILEGIIE